MVAPGESARSRKIAAVRAVARWGTRRFATLHSACPSGNYLLKGPRGRHTGAAARSPSLKEGRPSAGEDRMAGHPLGEQ